MSSFIARDENGVMWVESDKGAFFGIVSQLEIIDQKRLKIENDTLSVLEENNFVIEQDFDREVTFLEFRESNSETCRIEFCNGSVKYLTNDEIEQD